MERMIFSTRKIVWPRERERAVGGVGIFGGVEIFIKLS
jgi:hypothetical protein